MPYRFHFVFLLLLLAGFATSGAAQPLDLKFEHLKVEDGLSQTTVNTIYQDTQGYIWLGTGDGLNRYDGYDVKVYKHDPDDANSLPGNAISAVYEPPSEPGVLWVGTFATGLSRFDQRTGRFTNFAFSDDGLRGRQVRALHEDRAGTLWIGTDGGLHRYDRDAGTFAAYTHELENPRSLSSDQVRALHEDRAGTLWIGTSDGLNRFEPETETFGHFRHDETDPASLSSDAVSTLFEDLAGTLWVGTYGGGLNRFEPETETFTRFRHDKSDDTSLGGNYVSALAEVATEPGVLWVGTYGDGLSRLDTATETVTRFRHQPSKPASLGQDRVHALLGDRTGALWVGTDFAGVSRANVGAGGFAHFNHDPDDANSLDDPVVWRVLEDREGMVWVSTITGLNRIDRANGRVTRFQHDEDDPSTISSNGIRALFEDRDGTLWIGTSKGLDRYERGTGAFRRYELFPALKPNQIVFDVVQDGVGDLWVAIYNGGLVRLDPRTGAVTHYRHDEDDPYSLGSNRILDLYHTRDGALWLGTADGGVNRFDRHREMFTRYVHEPGNPNSLSHNFAGALHETADGTLWIGTYAGGLNCLHPETGKFVHFTEQNSDLPTNTINGILEDDAGHLWLSTHDGLSRFDPEAETFRNYGVDHRGLQSREFNGGAYFESAAGEFFFGGINGLNAFFPDAVTDNPTPPQVVLTELKIRNETVEPGGEGPLAEHVSAAENLRLRHHENDLSFGFVGLHYAAPEHNRYTYRLDGYDDDWRDVGTQRTATYTNLPPGRYTFQVRAASSDGLWSPEPAALGVVIRPPWWRTPWAYALYVLLVGVGVFAVDRIQRRRVILRERSRAEIREAQLQAQAAEARALLFKSENERKSRELEEARQLQLSMLPDTVPEHPEVEIAAFMKTAFEVGGDYYDFHLAEDGALTLAIGDATGHGANAGTMVTAAKSLFNVLAGEADLVEILRRASYAIKGLGLPKLYMALALAELRGRRLTLAGAGMPPALVYRAATGGIEEIPLKGMPLGGFADYPYRQATLSLAPGDTVVLLSDGFPEMFDEAGEMFGYDRTRATFAEVAERTPQQILDHFTGIVRTFAHNGHRDDDITFIVMKVKPDAA